MITTRCLIDNYELMHGDRELGVMPVHLNDLEITQLTIASATLMILEDMMTDRERVWDLAFETNWVYNYRWICLQDRDYWE